MEQPFDREIGGYFGMDLPYRGEPVPASYRRFQSGRAALRALLESSDVSRLWLPAYVCDAVIDAVRDSGLEYEFYTLDEHLYPFKLPRPLPSGSAVLYINYFGLCDENADRLLSDFLGEKIIIDNTQAFFSSPRSAFATIYSPRKFVGVPDGGYLVTDRIDVRLPAVHDSESIRRMNYLLRRFAYGATDGYPDYIVASKSLEDTRPLAMSHLTAKLLTSIDFSEVRTRRRDNFSVLSARLDQHNQRRWSLGASAVPLCYPLTLSSDMSDIRKGLAEMGIYVPTYWKDAEVRIPASGVESILLRKTLALPCDQRYSTARMNSVADALAELGIA